MFLEAEKRPGACYNEVWGALAAETSPRAYHNKSFGRVWTPKSVPELTLLRFGSFLEAETCPRAYFSKVWDVLGAESDRPPEI